MLVAKVMNLGIKTRTLVLQSSRSDVEQNQIPEWKTEKSFWQNQCDEDYVSVELEKKIKDPCIRW